MQHGLGHALHQPFQQVFGEPFLQGFAQPLGEPLGEPFPQGFGNLVSDRLPDQPTVNLLVRFVHGAHNVRLLEHPVVADIGPHTHLTRLAINDEIPFLGQRVEGVPDAAVGQVRYAREPLGEEREHPGITQVWRRNGHDIDQLLVGRQSRKIRVVPN